MPFLILFKPANSNYAQKAYDLLKKHDFDFSCVFKPWDSRLILFVEGRASYEGFPSIEGFIETYKDNQEFLLQKESKN